MDCLTEETFETVFSSSQEDGIAGVSGYTVRVKRVRCEKLRVSAFTSADDPRIPTLKSDLVLRFYDRQAVIASGLMRGGMAMMGNNPGEVAGVLTIIRCFSATVEHGERSAQLGDHHQQRLAKVFAKVEHKPFPTSISRNETIQ